MFCRPPNHIPPLQSYAVLGGGSLPAGQRISFEVDGASCCTSPPRDRQENVMLCVANILTASHYMGSVNLGIGRLGRSLFRALVFKLDMLTNFVGEATSSFKAKTCWLGQEDQPCSGQIIHYADTGFMALVVKNRLRQGLAFIFFSRLQIDSFHHYSHLTEEDGLTEFRM